MDQPVSTAATTKERDCLTWLAQPGPTPAADPTRQLDDGCLPIPLWEWTVPRDQIGASAGISRTRHAAIQALANSLTGAGRPRIGHVLPVLLTEPAHDAPYYLRGNPEATATFDGKAIQWTSNGSPAVTSGPPEPCHPQTAPTSPPQNASSATGPAGSSPGAAKPGATGPSPNPAPIRTSCCPPPLPTN